MAELFQKSEGEDLLCISLGSAVPKCEVKDMDEGFLQKLLFAQKIYGRKFKVNSAFRSVAYEKQQGRAGRSSHTKGIAADLGVTNHQQRLYIVAALIVAGFRRIGIAKNFIHVDDDASKVPSLWLYGKPDNSTTF